MGTVSKFESAEKRLLDPANAALEGQARVNAEIFTAVEILGRKLERVEAERDRLARRLALIESSATVDEKTGKLYLPALLPAQAPAPAASATPKWISIASIMSSALALFALGLVFFREPAPALTKDQVALLESLRNTQFTQLSPDNKNWKSLDSETAETANTASSAAAVPGSTPAVSPVTAPAAQQASAIPATPSQAASLQSAPSQPIAASASASAPAAQATPAATAQLPPPSELAKLEQTAEAAKPVATPVPADMPPPLPLTATDKTSNTDTADVNPQNVLIPGEDTIPEKAEKKSARKAAAPAQADREDAADSDATDNEAKTAATANVVPVSAEEGGIAPDKTLPKKLALLQKRAYKGIPEAQHDLATLYAAGTVIPQDYHRAAFWFTKAADNGVANANYNMGVIYHQGLGVPVDMAKALDWYARAAELGHPEAMYNLGIAYVEGIGTKTDIPKGVSYFKRAAKAGVVQAAYNLGVLYESNFIGPIDTQKAIEWYKVAAKAGHKGAQDALARLEAKSAAGAVADSGVQAQALADKVEPSAGGDEESGEGDSSPVAENANVNSGNEPKTLLADIQRILIKQGVLPGKPDGVLTQQTEDAIRASERKFGLNEDGQPSRQLLEKLLEAPPTEEHPFP